MREHVSMCLGESLIDKSRTARETTVGSVSAETATTTQAVEVSVPTDSRAARACGFSCTAVVCSGLSRALVANVFGPPKKMVACVWCLDSLEPTDNNT